MKHNRYDQTLPRQGQNNHAITCDGGLKVKKCRKYRKLSSRRTDTHFSDALANAKESVWPAITSRL